MTVRHQVPVRWCPIHADAAIEGAHRCQSAQWAHLAKPCPLTPPLFYETEGDTPDDHQKEGHADE